MVDELPPTQPIAARFLRPGDMVARADLSFGVIERQEHLEEIGAVMVSYLDGIDWIGEDTTPFPVALDRGDAHDWNLRRSQLSVGELAALHDRYHRSHA